MDNRRTNELRAGRAFLALADTGLKALIEQRPLYNPHAALVALPPMDSFGVLIFQVIGQQISIPATRAILDRVLDRFGGHLPTPDQLLSSEPGILAEAGVSARKATTIRALASLIMSRDLYDATLARMTDDEVEQTPTTIPGVGPWTVQGFLVLALDRPDAFPAGDLGIRRAIRELYHLDRLPTEGEAGARADGWRPHRALAAGYLISWDTERQNRGAQQSDISYVRRVACGLSTRGAGSMLAEREFSTAAPRQVSASWQAPH